MKNIILGFTFLLLVVITPFYIFTAGFSSAENNILEIVAPITEIDNKNDNEKPNLRDSRLLIVKIYPDGTLAINRMKIDGNINLKEQLHHIFEARESNGVFSDAMMNRDDVPDAEIIEKKVWILAARGVNKNRLDEVSKIIESAGAQPIKMLTDPAYRKLLDEPFNDPNQPLV